MAGTVGTQDEKVAAQNDLMKMEGEGWVVENSLSVDVSRALQGAQDSETADGLGQWIEPSASYKPNVPLCPGLTIVTAIASGGDY